MAKKIEKYYKIGEVAEMLGVHEDTLRNWDAHGLVTVERFGTRGDRRYTAEHIRQIREQGLVSDLARRRPNGRDYSECTKEQLIKEIEVLKKQRKYGLVWEEKMEGVVEMCKAQAPILQSVPKMNVKRGGDERRHIMIEGDNYHALQVLNYTHKGKIDVIYIDPPYNTGNKDFIFNDRLVDREDGYRHSKWLSFMEKRLQLAKDLMSNGGVIFISIDDNEQANLRSLCDEIFGETNFIGMLIWRKKEGGGQARTHFVVEHEYILVYAKSESFEWADEEIPVDESSFNKEDDAGKFKAVKLAKWGNTSKREDRPKMYFPIKDPNGRNVYPTAPDGADGRWRVGKDRMNHLIEENLILWQERDNKFVPYEKIYFDGKEVKKNKERSILYNLATTGDGANELTEIFGKKDTFENPKPTELIKFFAKFGAGEDAIVLDFFAGSGTTGHAVMELNKEDGGNRQFILCTNNENNNGNGHRGIAEGVCQPRIKKVMEGYEKNGGGEKVEGLGGNLEYLKTEFVDVENIADVSDKKRLEFTHQAGHMIALKENAFTEMEKNEWYQIFTDDENKFVGLYFRENLEKLEDLERKILDKKEVKLYIFSHGGSSDWANDYDEYDNVVVEDIPEPILRVYKSLNY